MWNLVHVGLNPITCEIEKRKLYFFGKLYNMNSKHILKKIFLNRLFTCVFYKDTVRYGFVPDILDIVQKYDLSEYITDYLLDGQFPGKLQWKKVVSLAFQSCQQQSWTSRVNSWLWFLTFYKYPQCSKLSKNLIVSYQLFWTTYSILYY